MYYTNYFTKAWNFAKRFWHRNKEKTFVVMDNLDRLGVFECQNDYRNVLFYARDSFLTNITQMEHRIPI